MIGPQQYKDAVQDTKGMYQARLGLIFSTDTLLLVLCTRYCLGLQGESEWPLFTILHILKRGFPPRSTRGGIQNPSPLPLI